MRILVIRLGGLGDVLNVFPALAGLKHTRPEAQLSWLVEEGAAPLVEVNRDIAQTFVLPRRRWQAALLEPRKIAPVPAEVARFVRHLKRCRFDLALDFQGTLKSGILGLLSGIPRRIGFAPPHCRELNHLFTTEQVALPDHPIARAQKNLALVHAVAPAAQCRAPRLRCPQEDTAFAESLTQGLRLKTRHVVGIHPGTSDFGRFKRWPVERHAEVARRMAEKLHARTLVTWGRGERPLAQRLVRLSGGTAVLAPPTTLTQLAEVIGRLDLFIASDTGPLHLAAILGKPVVAILGPKDPIIYGPYGSTSIIVRKNLDCSPCTKRRCSRMDCIMKIEAREVFDAASNILTRPPRS
jgi:lipopolysaccharide heptosyltransferase II